MPLQPEYVLSDLKYALNDKKINITNLPKGNYKHLLNSMVKSQLRFYTSEGNNVVQITPVKSKVDSITTSSEIVSLLRYSAYLAVQHKNSVDFIDVQTFKLMQFSRANIRLADEIVAIDYDLTAGRKFYVATKQQIYAYNCEALLATGD